MLVEIAALTLGAVASQLIISQTVDLYITVIAVTMAIAFNHYKEKRDK